MLRGFKMSHIEIRDSIKEMKEDAFSLDLLRAILNNLPTPDELNLIETYEGNRAELGNAEKFFIAIGQVPLLAIRVSSMEYKKSFDLCYSKVKRVFFVFFYPKRNHRP